MLYKTITLDLHLLDPMKKIVRCIVCPQKLLFLRMERVLGLQADTITQIAPEFSAASQLEIDDSFIGLTV